MRGGIDVPRSFRILFVLLPSTPPTHLPFIYVSLNGEALRKIGVVGPSVFLCARMSYFVCGLGIVITQCVAGVVIFQMKVRQYRLGITTSFAGKKLNFGSRGIRINGLPVSRFLALSRAEDRDVSFAIFLQY